MKSIYGDHFVLFRYRQGYFPAQQVKYHSYIETISYTVNRASRKGNASLSRAFTNFSAITELGVSGAYVTEAEADNR